MEKWAELQYTSTALIKSSPALIQYTSHTLIQSGFALSLSGHILIQCIYPALILSLATCVSPWWAQTPGTRHPGLGPGSLPDLGPGPGARWVYTACGHPTTEPGRDGAGQIVCASTQRNRQHVLCSPVRPWRQRRCLFQSWTAATPPCRQGLCDSAPRLTPPPADLPAGCPRRLNKHTLSYDHCTVPAHLGTGPTDLAAVAAANQCVGVFGVVLKAD